MDVLWLAGDASADIAVQEGDEIIVPRISEVVYVVGMFSSPATTDMLRVQPLSSTSI